MTRSARGRLFKTEVTEIDIAWAFNVVVRIARECRTWIGGEIGPRLNSSGPPAR